MKYIGFVPKLIKCFVERFETHGLTFEEFKECCSTRALGVLIADLEAEDDGDCGAYSRKYANVYAIALCVMGGVPEKELVMTYNTEKEWLAWTFLKQEKSHELDSKITAFSPLA